MSTEPRTKAAQRMIEWYQSWHRPQPRDMPGFRRRIAAIEREAAERASESATRQWLPAHIHADDDPSGERCLYSHRLPGEGL